MAGAAALGALILGIAVFVALPDGDDGARAAAPRPPALPQASVTVDPGAAAIPVPRSYFGVSTEYWTLPIYERRLVTFEHVLSLLRVPGNGPMVLRVGGDSADQTFWGASVRVVPKWMFLLRAASLRRTGAIVRRLGLRLILDLNLVTGTPAMAARWAQAAERELPRGSIAGFEVGNEPDLYSHWYWVALTEHSQVVFLPGGMNAAGYARAFQTYSTALSTVAPGLPLAGPAVGNAVLDRSWITRLLQGPHPGLAIISAHRYPFSACVSRRSPSFPTIERILSERATTSMASALTPTIDMANAAGLPFRLTELNSVTCGGLTGVSNSFATALWAPDALFELLRVGLQGVNVHIRANTINGPFTLSRYGLRPRPLLYGLIMFVRALGSHPALVPASLSAAPQLHLKAWAVRASGNILHVLLLDKGNRSVRVALHLPTVGPATVSRLLAPAVSSRTGVTLGGQTLGADARWLGRPARETLVRRGRGYEVTVPKMSAALVSAQLAPGAVVRTGAPVGPRAQARGRRAARSRSRRR